MREGSINPRALGASRPRCRGRRKLASPRSDQRNRNIIVAGARELGGRYKAENDASTVKTPTFRERARLGLIRL